MKKRFCPNPLVQNATHSILALRPISDTGNYGLVLVTLWDVNLDFLKNVPVKTSNVNFLTALVSCNKNGDIMY